MLSERPAEAGDRAVPGHWEGDSIIGSNRSAIGTVVERAGGCWAIAMDALTTTTATPAELLRSLTWERGEGLSAHARSKVDTGIAVHVAGPHPPWQRGTNEDPPRAGGAPTDGLLRQCFQPPR